MTTTDSTAPERRKAKLTLGEAFAEFVRHPSPWMIAAVLFGALAARIWIGEWALSDLIAPLVYLALFPVMEWVIHVFVLHWRPRQLGRWTVDTLLARKHREHHVAPRDVPLVFIPWQTLIGVIAANVVLPLWLFPTHRAGADVHDDRRRDGADLRVDPLPRAHRLQAAVARLPGGLQAHRLHHFKNENYWMTVTTANTADRLFGTMPDPASVATSPTAKNLHGLRDSGR